MQKDAIILIAGSLNPITKGHIAMAEAAYTFVTNDLQRNVKQILLLPSNETYPYKHLESNAHRAKMINLAIQHSQLKDLISLEDQDLRHPAWRPTAESINELKHKQHNDYDIFMVSGSDQLKFMCTPKWSPENIDDMLNDCSLIVFERLEGAGAVEN